MTALHSNGVFVVIEGTISRIVSIFLGLFWTGAIAPADTARGVALSLRNIVEMKEYHYGTRGIPSGPS